MEQTENKNSKKLIIFEIVCVLIMIALIGYTYSYFNISVTNNTAITGKAASLSLTLNVSKVAPSNTNGLIPQLDEYITSAVIGRNGSCIDDNNNNVCQVYQIKVKNTSAVSLYANGTVILDNKNNPNLKWAQISGTSSPTLVSSVNTPSTVTLVENELFTASEEKIYYIVVWISETGEAQYDTGSFTGTVTFGDNNPSPAEQTLTKLNLTKNTDIPDFSKTSCSSDCDEATVGIYETEDDLGTSYYFRGDVENNYVKFGKWNQNTPDIYIDDYGASYLTLVECENYSENCTLLTRAGEDMYWRIVRINGDGSIRMIYDGISAHSNGEGFSYDRAISFEYISFNDTYSDNTYVGYMTGTVGASDYSSTHSNTTDSTIKGTIDNWYKTNIVDTGYSESVVDAIYCNDREFSVADSSYTGDGSGTTTTAYKGRERLQTNKTPTLKCSQVNDRFTTEATIGNVLGNDKLIYPVGLITADEVSMAGGIRYESTSSKNLLYYLYIEDCYWTMTPSVFINSKASVYAMETRGWLRSSYGTSGNAGGVVRPVISISPDAILYGDGTATNPFRMTSEV